MKCAGLAAALALSLLVHPVRADDVAPETLFQSGATALGRGAYQEAIDDFEALSDRGFEHPSASFDRGLAYLMRLRAKTDRPGDLGRAAAAFEEATRLGSGDAIADKELERVRAEVTRRRARKGRDDIDARPTLDRAVVGLLATSMWEALVFASSLALAAGLVLRRWRGGAHVAGSVMSPAAVVLLLVFVPLAAESRWLAETTRAAVVVVPEVPLADATGAPLPGIVIPEAASVEVGARDGSLVHARWGAREGWIPATSLRLMPP